MTENKKPYRVSQITGRITWQVEELWEGGTKRGPFGSKEAAILGEEKIARDKGYIDELVLQEVVGEEVKPIDAFEKDAKGDWHCIQACSIDMENKRLVFSTGLTFTKGTPYMGVDVASWLDEKLK